MKPHGLTTAAGLLGLLHAAAPAALEAQQQPAPVSLTYLGAAGWEITDGKTVVLLDPYLSRNAFGILPTDTLAPNDELLAALIPKADYILVHHTHPDHISDVPFIALRTGAMVIGSPSTVHVMQAYGVPRRQIFSVGGGEDMVLPGGLSILVIPAIHGPWFNPDVIPDTVSRPMRIWSLHTAGRPLMFLIRLAGRKILTMGSMGYIEREVDGLRPDILLAGAGRGRRGIYEYTPRLLRALGNPAVVLPTHFDNFGIPFGFPRSAVITSNLETFTKEVHTASPETEVVIPQRLETITVGSDGEITRARLKPRVDDLLVTPLPSDAALLSHFDRGTLDASIGAGWVPYSDGVWPEAGGTSSSHLRLTTDGAQASPGSLLVSGEVGDAPDSYAGAMLSLTNGVVPWVSLSDYTNLTFWAKGDGKSYEVRLWAPTVIPGGAGVAFEALPKWHKVTIPLASFGELPAGVGRLVFVTTGPAGPFQFQLDQLRVE